MTDDLQAALRLEVRACLKVAGLSQAEAAQTLGISTKHMSQMLTGRAPMSIAWADRITRLTGRELLIASRFGPEAPA
ncbi:helix-turn-helix transcriptional regulator [Streptomyces sp.]|uniref:helix-turn-helix transcriptional regulator n=1 Tax=Streptomyces sp. TaxID=1931 RepID=UPI002F94086D